jgi:iron complex transport system ATP-binding protein
VTLRMVKGVVTTLAMTGVDVRRGSSLVLTQLNWTVLSDQRWVVLGPNGSGKTTMVQLASGYLHPTSGRVEILGATLGRVDVRRLRERIGLVSAALTRMLLPTVTATEVIVTGRHGALEPWWHPYGASERSEAARLLEEAGFGYLSDQPFGVISEGERQQVLLARALMSRPELLLLDEPAAGLDISGRERLISRLATLAQSAQTPPMVLVTHHLEEIPPGFTHLLLLRRGSTVAQGPIEETLTAANLSACFGLPLRVEHSDGRWTSRAC